MSSQTPPPSSSKHSLTPSKSHRTIARLAVTSNYFFFALFSFFIARSVLTLNKRFLLLFLFLMILQKLFLKRSPRIARWICRTFHPELYFNKFQTIYEQQVPNHGVLFAIHPHGIWSLGMILAMNQNKDPFSMMTLLGSRFILNVPFFGGLLRLWGIESVNASNMARLMDNQTNIGLVPGGYEQATITSQHHFRVFIKNRKGFIKLALKSGYKICPVLVMNEHKMYWTSDFGMTVRLWLNKIKCPGALFWGRFGVLPDYNLDVYNVVGKPIELPKMENPGNDDVEHWHRVYVERVKELYEKYKGLNGNSPLEIF